MLHFEGDKTFPQAPEDLWARLTDARFLARCIPDVESVSRAEPELAVFIIRPGLSFVRGTLELAVRVTEAVKATSARFQVHSKGIGSTSTVEAALDFAPHEGGTRLHWGAEVKELGGLLKPVPQGLIKAAAQKIIGDVWARLESQLAVEAGPPGAVPEQPPA